MFLKLTKLNDGREVLINFEGVHAFEQIMDYNSEHTRIYMLDGKTCFDVKETYSKVTKMLQEALSHERGA